ncbi:MAG: N-acetyltransferase [Pseudomonadota bacterium]
MRVRRADSGEADAIRALYVSAFSEGENELVASLAVDLLTDATDPPTLSLVSHAGEELLGHIAFSPVFAEAGDPALGYILAPLGVMPDHQGSRVGTALVEFGLAHLREQGVGAVLVYGDPAYYGRFGFEALAAQAFVPPYPLSQPKGWQALILDSRGAPAQASEITCVRPLSDPTLW